MKLIKEFCKQKGISEDMQDAFITYVCSAYNIKKDDTVSGKLTLKKIDAMWLNFLNDFKQTLVLE